MVRAKWIPVKFTAPFAEISLSVGDGSILMKIKPWQVSIDTGIKSSANLFKSKKLASSAK
jgi:hypothetical protein